MNINSIPPVQSAQPPQPAGKSEAANARKQADIREESRVQDNKRADAQRAVLQNAQQKKTQETVKPSVNSNGQQLGKLINTTA